jgi:protein phosphatase 1 regulatory subunit 21
MGSELQTKYQKLAQEYAKLRAQVDVLKQGMKEGQKNKLALEEELRVKDLGLRKHAQENESLVFRNQQLSKRVSMLQDELDSLSKNKKKKDNPTGLSFSSDIQNEELAAKISENEQLHSRIFELSQKSQKTINQLKEKIVSLEQEVKNNDALINEMTKDNQLKYDQLEQDKLLLHAKVEQLTEDIQQSKLSNGSYTSDIETKSSISMPIKSIFDDSSNSKFSALNVSVANQQANSQINVTFSAIKTVVLNFLNNLSSFLSYIKQRCSAYTLNSNTVVSTVDDKLSNSVKLFSGVIEDCLSAINQYYISSESAVFMDKSSLKTFHSSLKLVCCHMETFATYFQLRLDFENEESMCGYDLTQTNTSIGVLFKKLPQSLCSFADYIELLFMANVNSTHVTVIFDKLKLCAETLNEDLSAIANLINSKVTQEYQMPTTQQRVKTINECLISSFSQLCSTSLEFIDCLGRHAGSFCSAFGEVKESNSGTVTNTTLVSNLHSRAVSYHTAVYSQEQCPVVPYLISIHQSKDLNDISDSHLSLSQQIKSLQEQLEVAVEEKEQISVKLQLLQIKHDKRLKRNSDIETLDVPLMTSTGVRYLCSVW